MAHAPRLTLADYLDAEVRIACRKCDRRWQYRRAALIVLYGESAALPDVLAQLTRDCPNRGAVSNKASGAYFPNLAEHTLMPRWR